MKTLWHLALRTFGLILVADAVLVPIYELFAQLPVIFVSEWVLPIIVWIGIEAVIAESQPEVISDGR